MFRRFLALLLILCLFSAIFATNATAASAYGTPFFDPSEYFVLYNAATEKILTTESIDLEVSDGTVVKALALADATLNDDEEVVCDAENIFLFDYAVCDCEEQNAFFRCVDGNYLCSDGTHTTVGSGSSDFNLEHPEDGYYIRLGIESETPLYLKAEANALTCAPMGEDTENYIFTFHALAGAEPELIEYEGFDDVDEDAWFYDSVVFSIQYGLMNGVGKDKFDPNGNVTRAMLVTVLYRSELEPDVSELDNPFTDVKANQWYTDAVIWAAEEGIVKGMTATTFEPAISISREQIATILYRYAKSKDTVYTGYIDDALDRFEDAAAVSDYAATAVKWAVRKNIINGSDGKLVPNAPATRAQTAAMLERYIDYIHH